MSYARTGHLPGPPPSLFALSRLPRAAVIVGCCARFRTPRDGVRTERGGPENAPLAEGGPKVKKAARAGPKRGPRRSGRVRFPRVSRGVQHLPVSPPQKALEVSVSPPAIRHLHQAKTPTSPPSIGRSRGPSAPPNPTLRQRESPSNGVAESREEQAKGNLTDGKVRLADRLEAQERAVRHLHSGQVVARMRRADGAHPRSLAGQESPTCRKLALCDAERGAQAAEPAYGFATPPQPRCRAPCPLLPGSGFLGPAGAQSKQPGAHQSGGG